MRMERPREGALAPLDSVRTSGRPAGPIASDSAAQSYLLDPATVFFIYSSKNRLSSQAHSSRDHVGRSLKIFCPVQGLVYALRSSNVRSSCKVSLSTRVKR